MPRNGSPDLEVVHVKLPRAMVKEIDHLAVDEDLYRQEAVSRLLSYALKTLNGRLPEMEMVG